LCLTWGWDELVVASLHFLCTLLLSPWFKSYHIVRQAPQKTQQYFFLFIMCCVVFVYICCVIAM
jgi:hypothetical protein